MALANSVTILLVDDDPMIRSLGGELLAHLGYEVITAADGPAAVRAYRQHGSVDLVILDHHLPGHSGLSVLQTLKTGDPGVRVLMASGYFSPHEVVRLRDSGAVGLIHKPFRVGELETRIRLALAGLSGW
jgi:DNA-binding response OmpR family regulator